MESRPNKNPTRHIRIAQINAQNSKSVLDEIRTCPTCERIDILAIQEPYSFRNSIGSFGPNTKIITDNKKFSNLSGPCTIITAVVVKNPSLTILKLEQFSNTHCICIEVSTQDFQLYIINMYFQCSDNIQPYLHHLETILQSIDSNNIVITLDSNSKSPLWFNDSTDIRGKAMEDFIAQFRLHIVNSPDNPPTFNNAHQQTNIDLTLSTNNYYERITSWTVHPDNTTSDHNLITFNIDAPLSTTDSNLIRRFNTKRADWEKFEKILLNLKDQYPPISNDPYLEDPEILSNRVHDLINTASKASIPTKTRFPRSVPWWTPNLSSLRSEVRQLKRKYQSENSTDTKTILKSQYRQIRNKYTATIRKTKIQSWRDFVTKHGNSNPWGIAYKIQMNKIHPEQARESIRTVDGQTTTWEETSRILLNSLVPDDSPKTETTLHSNIRANSSTCPDTPNAPFFEMEEVKLALSKFKNNKAPGLDAIEVVTLKRAWKPLAQEITLLFNSCLARGKFPTRWKIGNIRVLLKNENKSRTDPKSYRPICLLPVISKLLEKLIATRISDLLHKHPQASKFQYGFRPGLSTEHAILQLREATQTSPEKYAIALLLDISGAFDNVWWPAILTQLKARQCPSNFFSLIQDYLSNRNVQMIDNGREISKSVTKGCPQGSVLGPYLWNLTFDNHLNTILNCGYKITAYADDLAVTIPGSSRKEIEDRAKIITNIISIWCNKNKLQLSESKSEILLTKGFLDNRRPPTIYIANRSLKMPLCTRYLGIHFGARFNITPHIDEITTRSKKIFDKLSRIAKTHWGLNHRCMSTIYTGLFVPIITYAAAGWADKINKWYARKLRQAQRHALIKITRAYRTTPSDALTAIAVSEPFLFCLPNAKQSSISETINPLTYATSTSPPQIPIYLQKK